MADEKRERTRRPEVSKQSGTAIPKSKWKMKRVPPAMDETIHEASKLLNMSEQQIFSWILENGMEPGTTPEELTRYIQADMEMNFARRYSGDYKPEADDEIPG